MVTETDLHIDTFKVDVKCARGFIGEPKAEACEHPGLPYKLTACEWSNVCVSPDDTSGYLITETSVKADDFKVTVSCSAEDGYHGTAVVTGCSKKDNRYTLAGCKGFVCSAPSDPEGYLLTELDLRGDSFDVQAKCAPGFHGTATAKNCLRHLDGYRLEGCVRAEVCFSPKTSVGYDVTETSLSRPNWKVEAKCADGYTGVPKVTKCKQGLEAYELSGCEAKINCDSPDSTDGYLVTERNTVAQLFDVAVSCARGWEGTAQVAPCAASGEKYSLTGCSYSTLTCAAPKSTDGYLVTEVELRKIVFDVAVKCAPGYVGVAKVQSCEKDLGEYILWLRESTGLCLSQGFERLQRHGSVFGQGQL